MQKSPDMELPGYRAYLSRHGKKYLAVYHSLRESILEGRLKTGERLPPGRELARRHGLSRGTVNIAYEMLIAEGYLNARVGSGTTVSFPGQPGPGKATGRPAVRPAISQWGRRLTDRSHATAGAQDTRKVNFILGQPDPSAFPKLAWKQALQRAIRELNDLSAVRGNEIFGYRPLREAVAAYLGRHRGLVLRPEEVCIVNGSIQAIALLCQLLVDPGDTVVVENPGYSGTRTAIRAAGGKVHPVGLDAAGLRPLSRSARLAFVTPSNQFPTGRILSLERRLGLLEWARVHNAILVEDDYDSEFQRDRRPIEPLKALDREQGRVVFLGSFSKTISPALRLGYAVLPPALIEPFTRARQTFETEPGALLEQAAVAGFMKSGRYEKHLRKISRIYGDKRELFLKLLERELFGAFAWERTSSGLHLFGRWNRSARAFAAFERNCQARGLVWSDPRRYYAKANKPAVALGFSHLGEKEMRTGVKIMKAALE